MQKSYYEFKWERVAGASAYQIQIATEKTFEQNITDSATITLREFISDSLKAGKTYFWRVRAISAPQKSSWSPINRFRIDGFNIADRLVAYYPLDGSAEDDSILFSITAQDEDDPILCCNWYYDETILFTDTTTNGISTFACHFPYGSVGNHSIKVTASDGKLIADMIWSITVKEKAPPRLMVHYMPWYQTKPIRDYWGWHWTMDHFNPEKMDDTGKKEIASHYYPLTGPYDSNDDDILEYQVLLMKLTGIDGIIADWYGMEDFWDYGLIKESTYHIFQYAKKANLSFAVCYEDKTIGNMVNNNYLAAGEALPHAQKVIQYLEQNWFSDDNHLQLEDRPVLLTYGPQYFHNSSDWGNIFSVLNIAPHFFTLDNLLHPIAAGAYCWPPMWKSVDFQYSRTTGRNTG